MKLFWGKEDETLVKLLKQARLEFIFDPSKSKSRLMQTLAYAEQNREAAKSLGLFVFRYGMMAIGLVLVVSGGVIYASTGSEPGDTLFAINKLEDRIILSLPIGDLKKADYQTHIASNRLESLSKVELKIDTTELQVETQRLETVKESNLSLNNAIDSISAKKLAFEAAGKLEQAAQMSLVLGKLANIAGQYELKFESLESGTKNEKIKESIREHLAELKKTRVKAEMQSQVPNGPKESSSK